MKLKEVLMSVDQHTKRPGAKLYSKGRASDLVTPLGGYPVPSGCVQMTESACPKGNQAKLDIPERGAVKE